MRKEYKTKAKLIEEIFDNPWERLAYAIINQGADDLKRIMQGRQPTYEHDGLKVNSKELECFFNGEWFLLLSGMDFQGEQIFEFICESIKEAIYEN